MMKTLLLMFACVALLQSCSSSSAPPGPNDITGLWKSRASDSDKPRSLVAVYEYEGKYYGRMIVTYDDDGKIEDTILEQKDKAPGVEGNPPYCGMDFVYNVEKEEEENKYKGKIIDPKRGKVYRVELWRKGENLMVRGELWIFGRTIHWSPASASDLPKGFSMSKIKSFIPVIPKVE